MKGILCWIGGKANLAKRIVELFPSHFTYVEVFGGAMHVMFAKPPFGVEIYNDIDSYLVNFWRVVRDKEKYKELQRRLALTPYSREEYYECVENYEKAEDEIERAYRWFIAVKMAFAGALGKGWGFSRGAEGDRISQVVSGYLGAIAGLDKIHERIMRVQIENRDYKEIFNLYDDEGTLFYCDPPYVLETRSGKYYRHEFSNSDHEELVDLVLKLKGKVIISGYEHKIYRRLDANGWKRIEIEMPLYSAKIKNGTRPRRTEVLWLNYEPTGGLFSEEVFKSRHED